MDDELDTAGPSSAAIQQPESVTDGIDPLAETDESVVEPAGGQRLYRL